MLLPSLLATLLAAAAPHDPEGRLAALSARVERAPRDGALRLERARLALTLGDLATARTDLAVATRCAADEAAVTVLTAELEAHDGNDVAVLQACRRAAALGVQSPALSRLQGRALVQLRRHGEAAQAFAAAGPVSPAHWLELAAARSASGDVDGARADLATARQRLGPVVGLVDAAVALELRVGHAADALALIETLRPFVRRPAVLHARRARVFTAMGAHAHAAAERRLAADAVASPPVVENHGEAAVPAVFAGSPARARAAAPLVRLVGSGATWRHWGRAVPPPPGWQLPGFDDTNWLVGAAQLGYGDGDEATVVPSGPAGAHWPACWFRHEFVATPAAALAGARVRVLCDDGAVVFVNGVEVGRWNLPNGPLPPTAAASVAVAGPGESAWHTFAVPPNLLVPGTNAIAVAVHQVGPTSSDLSFDCAVESGPGPITVLRGPYLQNGTPTSATVRWRTDQPTTTQLWLGASATALLPAAFDATRRTDHAATVSGLAPETTYHYAIGDAAGPFPGQAPATLRTLPPAGAVRPLRAWVLGDAGSGLAGQYTVRDQFAAFAATQPADMLLLLGDNAYPTGTDAEYQVGVFDVYGDRLRTTFGWSALGNHDATFVQTGSQAGTWYDVFDLPRAGEAGGLPSGTEAYYAFDRGHVHFVCLDSMDSDRTAAGAMMTWLQADLAATNARWLVAFFHHPPYSAGSHHSDNPLDSGGRMVDMRQVALPILEAAGVDLVLCGHSHSYERSFLLDGHYGPGASLQPAMVLDRGDGSAAGDGVYGKRSTGLVGHEGAVYVVAGSSGATGGGLLNHPAMHVALDRLGSFVLDIDGDRLDGTFLGPTGVEDSFTLIKGDPRTLHRGEPRIAVAAGGRQDFTLDAGALHAGRLYVLAGAFGTTPGLVLGGLPVPLNADAWLQQSLALANSPIYPNSIGVLDANGHASAAFVLPPGAVPSLVGLELWHAYVVADGSGLVHASNAVRVAFTP